MTLIFRQITKVDATAVSTNHVWTIRLSPSLKHDLPSSNIPLNILFMVVKVVESGLCRWSPIRVVSASIHRVYSVCGIVYGKSAILCQLFDVSFILSTDISVSFTIEFMFWDELNARLKIELYGESILPCCAVELPARQEVYSSNPYQQLESDRIMSYEPPIEVETAIQVAVWCNDGDS